jgi:hypothetical protein
MSPGYEGDHMTAEERTGVGDPQPDEALLVDKDRDTVGGVLETQHEPIPLRAGAPDDLAPDDHVRV